MNPLRVLKETCQEHKLNEFRVQQMDQVFENTLKGKLKSPFKQKLKPEEGYLMLKLILKAGNGDRENPMSL